MGFDDILENPAFWILTGLGVVAIVIGWIISRKSELGSLPTWQMLVLILGVIIAAAVFANKD